MVQRRTQTEAYWVEDFELEDSDIEHLYNVLLERETPLSAEEMALVLVRYRVQREEEERASKVLPGALYRPEAVYRVGDTLTFPQFGMAGGKVIDVRAGDNPDYGDFAVIRVQMDDGREVDVASALTVHHALDDVEVVDDGVEEELLPPEELFIDYGGDVAERIEERLAAHDDLVRLAGRWFPRSLLVDVNAGHLNLAEAVLDIQGGGPLTTGEILDQIGMLDNVNPRLAEFSMNYSLWQDDRFDEVGPSGQVLWYLVRMEPEEVRTPPERLAYEPIPYDPEVLTPELRQLELEIGDEHSDIPPERRVPQSVTVRVTYPHTRAGTLPLSHQLRRMFPTAYEAPRIRFTLLDAESGEEMPAWVVRTGGYVYGLDQWFARHDIPVGGYLTIERTDVPGVVRIDYARRANPRKEWVLTAVVENERLRFENRQISIGCDYDELMCIAVEDSDAVDALWRKYRRINLGLDEIMLDVAREMAALNPQGNIHATTLYSAVNIVRRTPPGPVFARLLALRQFEHVGGPYWQLVDAQAGQG